MKKLIWVAMLPILVGISGCAEMLKKQTTAKLEAQCEAMGKKFLEKQATAKEYILVSSAEVSGECVDPLDPRLVSSTDR